MRNPTTFLVFFALMILATPLTLATSNLYENLGSPHTNFDLTTNESISGNFHRLTDLSKVTISSATALNPTSHPFVADLDHNGTPEIILIEQGNVKIFQGNDLTPKDQLSVGTSNFFNPVIFDVDGNGRDDIVLVKQGDRNATFIEWDGTNLYGAQSVFLTGANTLNRGVIGCNDVGSCIWAGDNTGSPTTFFMQQFNHTGVSSQVTITGPSAGISRYAVNQPFFNLVDIDGDGTDEFVQGFLQDGGGGANLRIYQFSGYSSPSATQIVNHNGVTVSGVNIHDQYGAVTTMDIDGFPGDEIVFGGVTATDGFRMWAYTIEGNLIDDFPETLLGLIDGDVDGSIVSNAFKANVFPDVDDEFCVMGFNAPTVNHASLLCASITGSTLFNLFNEYDNGESWSYSGAPFQYNLTTATDPINRPYSPIVHAIDHGTTSNSGSYSLTDEILTPYGIFHIREPTEDENSLGIAYGTTLKESAIIAADVEGNLNQDLIFLTSTNLFYHDDAFLNVGATITDISSNPCLKSLIKVNETVEFQITVEDKDGDLVSFNSSAYQKNNDNVQSTLWSSNQTSGTTFPGSFTANKTGQSFFFNVYVRDTHNADTLYDTITVPFSVANNGAKFGDGSCSVYSTVISTDDSGNITSNEVVGTSQDNGISKLASGFADLTGLGSTVFWLGIMIVLALLVLTHGGTQSITKIVVLFVVESAALVVGVMLGFIPFAILLIIIIVSLVPTSLWLRKFVAGSD